MPGKLKFSLSYESPYDGQNCSKMTIGITLAEYMTPLYEACIDYCRCLARFNVHNRLRTFPLVHFIK